jgi:hypothetical protein
MRLPVSRASVGSVIPRKVLELGSYERQASSRTPRELALTAHGQPAIWTERRVRVVAAPKRAIRVVLEVQFWAASRQLQNDYRVLIGRVSRTSKLKHLSRSFQICGPTFLTRGQMNKKLIVNK